MFERDEIDREAKGWRQRTQFRLPLWEFDPARYPVGSTFEMWDRRWKVVGIRREKLQAISFDDCIEEGIVGTPYWLNCRGETLKDVPPCSDPDESIVAGWNAYCRETFRDWWQARYGETEESWDRNPEVWVVEIERTEPDADSYSEDPVSEPGRNRTRRVRPARRKRGHPVRQ